MSTPLIPGCGFRLKAGARVTWFHLGKPTQPPTTLPIDQEALPWGPTGNGPLDNALFIRRYAGGDPELPKRGGMTFQGESNERSWQTTMVLTAASRDGLFGPGWSGIPTEQEVNDYEATTKRGTGLYFTYRNLFDAPTAPEPDTPPPSGPVEGPGEPTEPDPGTEPTTPPCPVPAPLPELPEKVREAMRSIASWNGTVTIGPGRRARIRTIQRWLDRYREAVDDQERVRE